MNKCPYCTFRNIPGSDICESCLADLTALDGLQEKTSRITQEVLGLSLSELTPRDAVSVSENATVHEAILQMNGIKAGCVLVENSDGELSGILTERDILRNLPKKVEDISKTKVRHVMTRNVEILRPDNSVNFAMHQMSVNRFRHIPIVTKNNEAAILSSRDVLKYLARSLGGVSKKSTPVKKAAKVKKKVVKKKPVKKPVKKTVKKSKKPIKKKKK